MDRLASFFVMVLCGPYAMTLCGPYEMALCGLTAWLYVAHMYHHSVSRPSCRRLDAGPPNWIDVEVGTSLDHWMKAKLLIGLG